jgi:hypothetical protein
MAFINSASLADVRQPPRRNPHGIVIAGGHRYDTWIDKQLVTSIRVELSTNKASEGQITLFDPDFRYLNRYASADGAQQIVVIFWLGFGKELGKPVFKGLLDRVEYSDGKTTLIALDMGLKMRQEQKGEYHYKLDSVQIVRKLALRNGLKFEGPEKIEPPLEVHPSMIQDSKNDWQHSWERCRETGFDIYVRMDTLFCKEPARLGQPILRLRYRKDFQLKHGFSLTYKLPENPQGRPKIVEYRGRGRGGRRLTGISREHSRGHKPVEMRHDPSEHTKKHLTRRAHAHKEHQREPAWNCTVAIVPPLPALRPDVRDTVRLEDVPALFVGDYLVDDVTHELTGNNFETELNLYRDIGR